MTEPIGGNLRRFHVRPRADDPRLVEHYEAGTGQPDGFYMWAPDVDTALRALAQQMTHEAVQMDPSDPVRIALHRYISALATLLGDHQ